MSPGWWGRSTYAAVPSGRAPSSPSMVFIASSTRFWSASDSLPSIAPMSAFAPLQARSHADIGAMLGKLSGADQKRVLEAMHTIEGRLGARPEGTTAYVLRPHQPGDMGWVVHRHGALYAQEYGWEQRFEGLV